MPMRDELMSEMLDEVEDNTNESDEAALGDEEGSEEGVTIEVSEPPARGGEVDADSIISELAAVEGDLSVADLRKLPGAEAYTDAQLEQMWKEAVSPTKPARAYKFLNEKDEEVPDFENMTASELLQFKVSYQAMGKEQRKSFDEVIRNAQIGHFNEARMNAVLKQRDEMASKYNEISPKYEQQAQERKLLEYALTQYNLGNGQPLEAFITAFRNELGKAPEFAATGAAPDATGNDAALEAAGQRVYYETVLPNAARIASEYNANQKEVEDAILFYVEREPVDFMSPERLQEIIDHDVPMAFERAGYSNTTQAPAAPAPNAELEQIKKELAELKAAAKNTKVTAARSRKAPSAGGGVTPSVSPTMPVIKDRQSMKEYLRS